MKQAFEARAGLSRSCTAATAADGPGIRNAPHPASSFPIPFNGVPGGFRARLLARLVSGPGFDRPRSAGYGAPMTKRELPIGIRTFREIHEEGCYQLIEAQLIEALHERTGRRGAVLGD